MQSYLRLAVATAICGSLLSANSWSAYAAIPRPAGAVGDVSAVDDAGDDQIRFQSASNWQAVLVKQDLLPGDLLQTGPLGRLGLHFIDQTIIQLSHDSQLLVKTVPMGGTAQLQLNQGTIWARAERKGTGVDIETPSATAAIRGTEWSVNVVGGTTILKVADGTVVLKNAFGSVSVSAGEAASAQIGKAPEKILVTAPTGREQFQFYWEARRTFILWPVDDLLPAEERAANTRIKAEAPAVRTTEDQVTLAELALHTDGEAAARVAISVARQRPDLTGMQSARLDLVSAMLDGRSRLYGRAAAGFTKAAAVLAGSRLQTAVLGEAIALSLNHQQTEAKIAFDRLQMIPVISMRQQILAGMAQAWIDTSTTGAAKGLERLKKIQDLDPKDPRPSAFAAALSIVNNDYDGARVYAKESLSIDPNYGEGLNALALIQYEYDWDLDSAEKSALHAIQQEPGNSNFWNTYALILGKQGDQRGSARAFERAIDLDPADALAPANYALVLLNNNQLAPAKKQIDRSIALAPSSSLSSLPEGRLLIQSGDIDGAKNSFLDAVNLQPGSVEPDKGLAIAYYEDSDVNRAIQQLDAADRMDPHDPETPLIRSVIAQDLSDADTALITARESFQRYRDRGGIYSSLAQSRTEGSYLNNAFNRLSLFDWSRYYGDLVYNPFDSGSLFYQATALEHQDVFTDSAPGNSFLSPALTQGILLDPLSVSSRNRFTDLFRRPFTDVTMGGNLTMNDSGEAGWGVDGDVEGFINGSLPLAYSLTYGHTASETSRRDSLDKTNSANIFLGTTPTLDDHVIMWGQFSAIDDQLSRDVSPADVTLGTKARAVDAGVGYSHSFGARDNVNALFAAGTGDAKVFDNTAIANLLSTGFPGFDNVNETSQTTGYYSGLSQAVDLGPLILTYGAEGQISDTDINHNEKIGFDDFPLSEIDGSKDQLHDRMGRLFANGRAVLGAGFSLEGGLNLDRYKSETTDRTRPDPRIALAWQPVDGQWFRIGYRQDLVLPLLNSLAPVATLGLAPASTPLINGGTVKSAMARWDAEWSKHLFTSLDYEHQWLNGYSETITDAFGSFGVEQGHLDRLTASLNAWLGNGFGTFASATYEQSKDTTSDSGGNDLPFVPDWQTNFGVTWVSTAQLAVTLGESIIGQRTSSSGDPTLATAAFTNLGVEWQPLEKHLDLALNLFNIFNEQAKVADGVPAPGRTITVSAHVKF